MRGVSSNWGIYAPASLRTVPRYVRAIAAGLRRPMTMTTKSGIRWLRAAVLLGLVVAAHGVGCDRGDPLLPPRGALVGPPRQIVLVTIDTLRADRLGSYGHDRDTSPFIDRLARDGAQLMAAYAPAPVTVASHVSMLTGLRPHTHGAIRNVGRITRAEVPSLPSELRRCGYETAAFLSVPFLDPRAKRLPGFALVEHPPVGEIRPAADTFARAAAWVRAHAAEPFFVWLHAYDPHKPYAPPPPYDAMFWSGTAEDWRPPRTGFLRDGAPTPRQVAYVDALYDGEIRATDAALEAFFVAVGTAWREPPLVIVTADHGEVLAEHGHDLGMVYFHGKYPYIQSLHVPLIVHWPGHVAPGRRLTPVDITGLAPTIVDLVFGAPFATEVEGFADVVRGAEGGGAPPVRPPGSPARRQLFAFAPKAAHRGKIVRGGEFRAKETWSILEWPWHLIHHPWRGSALFDVRVDPLELTDRAAAEPARVARLRAAVETHFSAARPEVASDEPVDEALRRQLKSLGYVE